MKDEIVDDMTTIYKDWKDEIDSTQEQVKDTFRVDLRKAPPRARHVRVGRVADAKEDVFHLGKVLVYGKKLY